MAFFKIVRGPNIYLYLNTTLMLICVIMDMPCTVYCSAILEKMNKV